MNIQEANQQVLRPAMDVLVTVEETPDKPTSASATNIMAAYSSNAKVTDNGSVVKLMDLCDDGFLNDGSARPISTDALTGSDKYGFIVNNLADSNGSFSSAPVITVASSYNWDYITITLCDSENNLTQRTYENPVWSGGVATLILANFTPNQRCHIVKVSLGKAWQFDKESLVSASMVLRGVKTNLETGQFDLQGSECEFNAYVGSDGDRYIDIFSRMEKYSEIGFTCGYNEDMSALRSFYLTDASYDSEKKTLTVKGCDATIAFVEGDYPGKYVTGTYANVRQNHYNTIKEILTSSGITLQESGTVPAGSGSTVSNLLFENRSKRNIIAEAVALYRDPDDYCITYRDGGIPELIAGDVTTTWIINEEDVAGFTTEIEMNANEYDVNLVTYKTGGEEEIASQNGAVAGETYIINLSDAVKQVTSCTLGTATLITPYVLKLQCTTSGDMVVNGYFVKETVTEASITDPSQRGIAVQLSDLPKIPYQNGSLTANAIDNLLAESNLKYKFKWRGNYHIKPYDLINMKRVSSGNRYPGEYLYPNNTLYPKGGEQVTMRIISVTYDFAGGGLTSEIEARRCS